MFIHDDSNVRMVNGVRRDTVFCVLKLTHFSMLHRNTYRKIPETALSKQHLHLWPRKSIQFEHGSDWILHRRKCSMFHVPCSIFPYCVCVHDYIQIWALDKLTRFCCNLIFVLSLQKQSRSCVSSFLVINELSMLIHF